MRLFLEKQRCALTLSKSIWSSLCTTITLRLVLRGKPSPKLGIICERYWLLYLAPTFEQHMEPPPKTSNVQSNKKSYMHGV